jgi:hypothetical protein
MHFLFILYVLFAYFVWKVLYRLSEMILIPSLSRTNIYSRLEFYDIYEHLNLAECCLCGCL